MLFAALPCGSQLIYYTTLSFVCQEVFQTFFKFFSSSRLSPTLRCRSLAAPIVYHILPRLSTPFCKFFQDFSIFPASKVTALGLWVLYWLHQCGIPHCMCRFYWLLAGAVGKRQGIAIPYPSPTPLLTPGGIRCGGAYLLPRAWGNIGIRYPVQVDHPHFDISIRCFVFGLGSLAFQKITLGICLSFFIGGGWTVRSCGYVAF